MEEGEGLVSRLATVSINDPYPLQLWLQSNQIAERPVECNPNGSDASYVTPPTLKKDDGCTYVAIYGPMYSRGYKGGAGFRLLGSET